MIIHCDDGRYAHMPNCNERCNENGHWLERAVPAPWQVQPAPSPSHPDGHYGSGGEQRPDSEAEA